MKGTLGHYVVVVAVSLLLLQHASADEFYVDDDAPGSWCRSTDTGPSR